MSDTISSTGRAYAKLRNAIAPFGPRLLRFQRLRALVRKLDGKVLPEGERLVTTTSGWKIWVNPGDQAVARELIGSGEWQPEDARALAQHLPRGGVAVDIGGNIGYMTGVLATACGPDGNVFTFEPAATNVGLLRRTVASNGWDHVHVFHAACGDEMGELVLYKDSDNWGNHALAYDDVLHTAGGETVAVVTVDSALAEHRLSRVDVIKIDVQGWELQALRGAGSLKRFRPTVFAEFYPRGLEMAGTTPEEMWRELESWGVVGQLDPSGQFRPCDLATALGDPTDPDGFVDLVIQPRR
jgi:FkbM family methyltransferase